jgi:uncharacterized protein (TIGR02391 family)
MVDSTTARRADVMPQKVDPVWAKAVLGWWVEHANAALEDGKNRREYSFCSSGPRTDAMLERELQTRRVIGVVLGIGKVDALVRPMPGGHNFVELQTGLDLVRRALGKLATDAETAQHITGTSAPTMAADSLHPLIWDAASKLWHDEHHASAVQRAATFLNAHVQDLIGRRDVSDSALMAQAFSSSAPELGKPRLRWPGEDSDLTVKAMRTGLSQFGQGCFMAIRNPATHSTRDMSAQEALEQLAILSTFARWIDRCELIEAETQPQQIGA